MKELATKELLTNSQARLFPAKELTVVAVKDWMAEAWTACKEGSVAVTAKELPVEKWTVSKELMTAETTAQLAAAEMAKEAKPARTC